MAREAPYEAVVGEYGHSKRPGVVRRKLLFAVEVMLRAS